MGSSSSQLGGIRYSGLVWPAVLILLGAIALLVNTNVISADRLYRLADLWPLLLIVIGLELFIVRAPISSNVAAVAGVLVVLIAAGGSVAYVAAGAAVPGGRHTIFRTGAAGKLDHGSLEVDVGAATLKITGADIGSDLFRASVQYEGPGPDISYDSSNGRVEISQGSGFHFLGPQHFVMDLKLSSKTRWDLQIHSGAAADTYDLSTLNLKSLEDDTGASREDISLGTPNGTVPVSVNGGALTVNLHRPSGTDALVQVSGGAVNLTFDGHSQHAVGSVSAGNTSDNYFRVRISGGASTVTMDTTAPQG